MFTGLFTTEILFRVVAMGPTAFVRVRWYLFDTAVVAASLLGYLIDAEGLSVFRTFRMVSIQEEFIKVCWRFILLKTILSKIVVQLKEIYVHNFEH